MTTRFTLMRASLLLATVAIASTSCMRGGTSSAPPVHLVQDMDFQPKVKAQSRTTFAGWTDHRGQRLPVADSFGKTLVVPHGPAPDANLANRDASNQFVKQNPLPLTTKMVHLGREVSVLERGRDRFNIYCAVCHGYTGQGGNEKQGHGMVGRRWPVVVPNFHFVEGKDNRVPLLADGEIFEAISTGNGKTMPGYAARISVEDRWAIVHYVRALQS
ncbi:MAG TPA: cytochrome c, partial [Planctomycetota bacterium]|nr:cytochrome c [Planctomycetota bacterium]